MTFQKANLVSVLYQEKLTRGVGDHLLVRIMDRLTPINENNPSPTSLDS